jgi:hypothetical protein
MVAGAFQVKITNNELGGSGSAIFTLNSGDSFSIRNNFIYVNQFGILVNQIAGAGNFTIDNNSIISPCKIRITKAYAPIIRDNVLEQATTNTCNNNAQIDTDGNTLATTIQPPQIVGNQIKHRDESGKNEFRQSVHAASSAGSLETALKKQTEARRGLSSRAPCSPA